MAYQPAATAPQAPGAAGPQPGIPPVPVPPADQPPIPTPEEARGVPRVPRWLITVLGFLLSSIIGILLGYIVVSKLFPEHGLPRLW
jgi:hypothetical protein